MSVKADSTLVRCAPEALAVSARQVARYAGGMRYRVDASHRGLVGRALNAARRLANPAFVSSIHEVGALQGGIVTFRNGSSFPVPPPARDTGISAIAFCVCTIGGRLEEAVRAAMSVGTNLEGVLLDAAGVALLDALAARAYGAVQAQAQERRLHCGCRFGPGCEGLDLSLQRRLFEMADASSIGVRLNESCVMTPAKSVSFFTAWSTSRPSGGRRDRCASCTLAACPYRSRTPSPRSRQRTRVCDVDSLTSPAQL